VLRCETSLLMNSTLTKLVELRMDDFRALMLSRGEGGVGSVALAPEILAGKVRGRVVLEVG
jgi:hypothetical protein